MNCRAAISSILFLASIKFAYLTILNFDPTSSIKRPKNEKKMPVVLSKQEIISLITNAQTKKSSLILQLLYSSGLRVSELINLKRNDIDYTENIGWVRLGKGKKDRIFILSSKLSNMLKKFSDRNPDWIYLFSKSKPLTARNIQKIVKNTSKIAKIFKEVHTHTIRHSYATHLLDAGVDLRKIQSLLGHSSLATTQIYTHISSEQLKLIKNPLDNLQKH